MKHSKTLILGLLASGVLAGCSTTHNGLSPAPSYLQKNTTVSVKANSESQTATTTKNNKTAAQQGITYLEPIARNTANQSEQVDLANQFSDTDMVKLTADSLLVKDYLHYVFGELLNVNYILGEKLNTSKAQVTLNLQDKLSKRKLFTLSQQMLQERNIAIRYQDDMFYIHSVEDGGSGNLAFGYGASAANVPTTTADIMQMVPLKFGQQGQLSLVLPSIARVQYIPAGSQNAFMLKGKQGEITKALEFVQLLDQPAFSDRAIGIYKATFVTADEIKQKLPELLKQEGISTATSGTGSAVSLVSLDRTGNIVFFAPNQQIINRINFWLKQIDQPLSGSERQYFVYQPQFSRAADLGDSLKTLIDGSSGGSELTSNTSAASQNKQVNSNKNRKQSSTSAASNDEMKLVVDERANSLIFYTAGTTYQQMLPLIKQLDIMPKQVVLEMMIAEVTLTDEFKQGVEFALSNRGAVVQGGFNLENGSDGLSYLLSGTSGKLAFNLLQKNTYVNVLSRPSLAVRDGVPASIVVGNRIPIVGDIITDPVNGSRTSVEYLETGIDLQVTPTVNAQGVVLMEITQSISNQASSSGAEGNPIIFERSLQTEVIAGNGQTIMLGGLISENSTLSDRRVPFFSSIPIFGRLFDGTDNNTNKTELVVLVTPRIVDSTAEWESIYNEFKQGMSELKLSDTEGK